MVRKSTAKEIASHLYNICLNEYAQATTTKEIVAAWNKYCKGLEEHGIVANGLDYHFDERVNREGVQSRN
jgi:hypothetical protein